MVDLSFKKRRLHYETLEERQLLAVTAADFDAIRSQYSTQNFSAQLGDYNVIEITDLTEESLRNAILEAGQTSQNDLIVVRTSDTNNKITLSGKELTIGIDAEKFGSVTIVSLGEQKLTVDAQQQSRVIYIPEGNVSISGLILTNGGWVIAGGGIYNRGTLTVTDCTISKNDSDTGLDFDGQLCFGGKGGGIYNAGTLTMTNVLITQNCGGGFFGRGGGIDNDGILFMTDCVVSENFVGEGPGGGVASAGTATLTNCQIVNNRSINYGGGIYNDKSGLLAVNNSVISENTSWGYGAGLYNSGTASVTGSVISKNIFGGGVSNFCGSLTIVNSEISGNSKVMDGGGISSTGGLLTVVNCTIAGNSARWSGGGIYLYLTEQASISNTIISGNYATFGSAISTQSTDVTGGLLGQPSILVLRNVLIGENHGSEKELEFNSDLKVDGQKQILGYSPSFIVAPKFDSEGNLINAESMDLHLKSNSLAIDTGDTGFLNDQFMNVDLDGRPRVDGDAVDIGAYEFQSLPQQLEQVPQETDEMPSPVKPISMPSASQGIIFYENTKNGNRNQIFEQTDTANRVLEIDTYFSHKTGNSGQSNFEIESSFFETSPYAKNDRFNIIDAVYSSDPESELLLDDQAELNLQFTSNRFGKPRRV